MSTYVLFLALGLATGAVYALLGCGLVLEYRSSGVINFAQGAIATVIAYEYIELRSSGDLMLPLPFVHHDDRLVLHVADGGMALVPALVLCLLYAALLGLALYLFIFRFLRSAPLLGKVVASVGLLLLLQSLVQLQFGSTTKSTSAILPNGTVDLFGTTVPEDRLWLAAVAVIVAGVLWALYRFTRFGLATRAAAENDKGATLLGYSSDRIAAVNWVLATVLAGIAGVLIAPISTLSPTDFSLLIVPALAVALLGRFRSFGITAGAGLALGMLQSVITKWQSEWSWFPKYGVKEALPFLVILVAMVIAGQSLPGRGAFAEARSPKAARPSSPVVPAIGLSAAAAAALLVLPAVYRGGLIQSLLAALLCLSLVVLTGYVGQISLAQMSFAGVGGFAVSKLALEVGIPFPVTLVLAALIAVSLGLLVGVPALRVRGVQLAVITIAVAVAVSQFVFLNPDVSGSYGGVEVPPPRLFGLDLNVRSSDPVDYPRAAFGLLVLVVLALVAVAVTNLRRNGTGRRMLAVRANERAAAALGIDVRTTKLWAFALSAFIAGLAGGLIAYQQGQVSPESFAVMVSVTLVSVAYVGGIARVSGAITGGLVVATGGLLAVLFEQLIDLGRYEVLIGGLLLLAMAIAHPDGLASALEKPATRLHALLRERPAPSAPKAPSVSVVDRPPRPAPSAAVLLEPILSVQDLSVSFGGLRAVDGVALQVARGLVVGLIGPNGAGKTTFVDAVTGFLPQSRGTILFDGTPIHGLSVHQRARLGMARTFQTLELFDDLSVRENVLVASEPSRWWLPIADMVRHRGDANEQVDAALDLLGLTDLGSTYPPDLSHGQRKLVSVARAIAAQPKLLLLDEPAAGLDSAESRVLGERVRSVRDAGVDILLIDHDMALVLEVCDEIYVLDFGRVIAHGAPSAIRADPTVIGAYLGEPVECAHERVLAEPR